MKLLLFLLCFAIGAAAQTPQLKHITWSESPECGEKRNVPAADNVECDLIISNGRRVSLLEHNGLQIVATYGDDGDHVLLNSLFINRTGNRILVQPERFVILHYKTEPDRLTEKTLSIDRAIDPTAIAKRIKRGATWANVFSAMGAAAQTRESKMEARTNTGVTINGSETSPDYEARNRAAQSNADRSANAQSKANAIMETALLANTVFQGQQVGGYVYFPRNKKATYSEIGLIMEGSVYIFALRKE